MKLFHRYKRLNLWHKIAVWAGLASFLGLLLAILTICLSLLPHSYSSPEEISAQGDLFFHAKKFKKAIAFYSKALAMDPYNASIWRKKGVSYIGLAMGTTEFRYCIDNCRNSDVKLFLKALPCLERAIELDSKDKEAYLYCGIVYYRWGNLHSMLGPANNNQNACSKFAAAAELVLEKPNYDTYKWSYETSCSYYGMALVMARLSQRLDSSGYAENAEMLLRKAIETIPSCIPPDLTIDQVLFVSREPDSDPNSGFCSSLGIE